MSCLKGEVQIVGVVVVVSGVELDERPVVEAVALGALAGRDALPGPRWDFNGRMRDEFLNGTQFDSLFEAQVLTEAWRIDYNNHRPHSAHGWLTPVEFVERWVRG